MTVVCNSTISKLGETSPHTGSRPREYTRVTSRITTTLLPDHIPHNDKISSNFNHAHLCSTEENTAIHSPKFNTVSVFKNYTEKRNSCRQDVFLLHNRNLTEILVPMRVLSRIYHDLPLSAMDLLAVKYIVLRFPSYLFFGTSRSQSLMCEIDLLLFLLYFYRLPPVYL